MILKMWNLFLFVDRVISIQIREKTEAATVQTEKGPDFGNVSKSGGGFERCFYWVAVAATLLPRHADWK